MGRKSTESSLNIKNTSHTDSTLYFGKILKSTELPSEEDGAKKADRFHGDFVWKGGKGMYGEFEHTIDSKGRMNFPAKLRESLGERFFISKTIGETCLTVHTEQSWNSIRESLKGKPSKVRLPIERFLFGGACEAEPDKQGRIALPTSLRTYAGLTSEVVVVGMDDHAEIWDKALWEEYNNRMSPDDIAAFAEEIGL